MLISQPPWITDTDIEAAKESALAKKKLPAIRLVHVVALSEGPSAQLLHLGSYDDEGPKPARLHGSFLAARGLDLNGLHHEIYLNDARHRAREAEERSCASRSGRCRSWVGIPYPGRLYPGKGGPATRPHRIVCGGCVDCGG